MCIMNSSKSSFPNYIQDILNKKQLCFNITSFIIINSY